MLPKQEPADWKPVKEMIDPELNSSSTMCFKDVMIFVAVFVIENKAYWRRLFYFTLAIFYQGVGLKNKRKVQANLIWNKF